MDSETMGKSRDGHFTLIPCNIPGILGFLSHDPFRLSRVASSAPMKDAFFVRVHNLILQERSGQFELLGSAEEQAGKAVTVRWGVSTVKR